MKNHTFNYIISLIKNKIDEEIVVPTNSASSGAVSGLSGNEGDLPPVDLRKKKYKSLSGPYRELFRRKRNV